MLRALQYNFDVKGQIWDRFEAYVKTGNINLNQVNNWITTQYGTYYDITDGTLAINATPTQEDFLKVGGQTTIQGELRCENKIKENNLYLSDVYATINNVNITSNTLNTKIDTNLNLSSNYTFNTSNILNTKIDTNLNISSNYTFNTSNILNTKIDTNLNITSNSLNTNISNLLFDTNYTTERPYPPKAYNSHTEPTSVSYLGQSAFKETITLTTDTITYGSGTYEIYSSTYDDYNYISFINNGTLTLNSSIICDILIVGGGGGGGYDGGGGGGGGQVLYYTNDNVSFKTGNAITLNAGTYNINIGDGGVGGTSITINGVNGGTSSIINASTSTTILTAKGGGGGGSRNNIGNGGDIGGAGGNGHANSGSSQTSTNGGGSGGTNNGDNRGGGGGGGGANTSGTSKNGLNNQPSISRAGDGGAGVDINITGTSVGYGGGGGEIGRAHV
jgi:hypothetical protein